MTPQSAVVPLQRFLNQYLTVSKDDLCSFRSFMDFLRSLAHFLCFHTILKLLSTIFSPRSLQYYTRLDHILGCTFDSSVLKISHNVGLDLLNYEKLTKDLTKLKIKSSYFGCGWVLGSRFPQNENQYRCHVYACTFTHTHTLPTLSVSTHRAPPRTSITPAHVAQRTAHTTRELYPSHTPLHSRFLRFFNTFRSWLSEHLSCWFHLEKDQTWSKNENQTTARWTKRVG